MFNTPTYKTKKTDQVPRSPTSHQEEEEDRRRRRFGEGDR